MLKFLKNPFAAAVVLLFATFAIAQTASTMRTIPEVQALLADNTTGAISPQDLRDTVASLDDTGWAQYADTQYTCSGTPFSIIADTDTVLPNNAGQVLASERPVDIPSFYNGSVITGRTGDGVLITVDLTATPTSAAATYVELWFDIGAPVGELYRRIATFPKGNGAPRPVNFTVSGYTLGTWETNGATVYVRSNGPINVCNTRYVITRTHRGSRR